MDPWHIRPARDADHPSLLTLWERSVRATHDFLAEADIALLRPCVADVLASGDLELWVLATAAEAPVGWLGLAGAQIEALFLAPEVRGFYERLGFAVVGRSAMDGAGRPFPLLHLRRAAPASGPDSAAASNPPVERAT
jgi:putative acetyltransferase